MGCGLTLTKSIADGAMQFVRQTDPAISSLNTEAKIKVKVDWIVVLSTDSNRYINSTELVEHIEKKN
ncbi:MAG: hypothetical protein ABI045_05545 [Flavobacteriales bacterium]